MEQLREIFKQEFINIPNVSVLSGTKRNNIYIYALRGIVDKCYPYPILEENGSGELAFTRDSGPCMIVNNAKLHRWLIGKNS